MVVQGFIGSAHGGRHLQMEQPKNGLLPDPKPWMRPILRVGRAMVHLLLLLLLLLGSQYWFVLFMPCYCTCEAR